MSTVFWDLGRSLLLKLRHSTLVVVKSALMNEISCYYSWIQSIVIASDRSWWIPSGWAIVCVLLVPFYGRCSWIAFNIQYKQVHFDLYINIFSKPPSLPAFIASHPWPNTQVSSCLAGYKSLIQAIFLTQSRWSILSAALVIAKTLPYEWLS